MGAKKDIVIVGGGVIGLFSAYYCSLRGHRVTVVERGGERRDGCSYGNAGMVVPSHFVPLAAPGMVRLGLKWMWNPESPFYIKPRLNWDLLRWGMEFWKASNPGHVARSAPLLRDLSLASRAEFVALAGRGGMEFGLEERGLLMLCKAAEVLEEEGHTAEKARELGIPAEVLDAAQVARLEPDVRLDVVGGVYFPKDCHLAPHRLMAGLMERLDKSGVRFVWEQEVSGWTLEDDGRVRALCCGDKRIEGEEFVLCGGAWTPGLAMGLGARLPMQAGKGYSLTLDRPRRAPKICSILTEARVAVTPMGGALRVGGTMEIAGLDETVNPVRVWGIIRALPRYYPDYSETDFEGIQPWRGLRPCSPDGLPYLGRTRRCANVVIAAGHAMMGLSLGPITGRLVSELLSDGKTSLAVDLLHPDRFL